MNDVSPSVVSESNYEKQKKALKSTEVGATRDRRLLQGIQMTLSGGGHASKLSRNKNKSPERDVNIANADELIEKFNSMCLDKRCSAKDIKNLLTARNVTKFDTKDWQRISDMLFDAALRNSDIYFAVDMAICLIGYKEFQTSFADRISDEMSSFALTPQIADAALPELVAQLLTAQWPRVHSRSNFESNEILYQIITQLKGWIMAITDEVVVLWFLSRDEEDVNMMSRCASGLAEICNYGKRRFWLKWPELLDDIYLAAEEVLTSNSQISRLPNLILFIETVMIITRWVLPVPKDTHLLVCK
uniref:MIF4G domain-containing protein n=1 Tax=Syphacia muris TaxID=451379 RepID=A0A0N5A8B2_9BILA